MVFVEKRHAGKEDYYFITSTHRLPGGGWKKIRQYTGKTPPSSKQIAETEKELQEKAAAKGLSQKGEWVIVEEFGEKGPGRARPLTIIGEGILRWTGKNFFGGPNFERLVFYNKNGVSSLIFRKKDVERCANFFFRKTLNDPKWAEELNEHITDTAGAAFSYFNQFPKSFSSFSNSELAEWLEESTRVRGDCQEVGTAWLSLDWAPVPLFVNYLTQYLSKRSKNSPASAYATLSTPVERSNAQEEELDFVKLAKKIQEDEIALRSFTGKDFSLEDFESKSPRLFRLFKKHVEKYCWLPFMYEGPTWSESYFAKNISSILKSGTNLSELLDKVNQKPLELEEKQEELLSDFKVDDFHARLFEISRSIVYGRGFRKDAIYHGFYKLQPLYDEIASRLNVKKDELLYAYQWEIPEMLEGKRILSRLELSERHKQHAVFVENTVPEIHIGKKAQEFFSGLDIDKSLEKGQNDFSGVCAYPGQARGIVAVVNSPADLSKMEKGKILVSHATDPSLVVGMRKAAAIVTDLGGMACHAAIIARELKVPCVVGTKNASKMLKDGDLVAVDANHATVKREKRE